jgi:hypothetical protein
MKEEEKTQEEDCWFYQDDKANQMKAVCCDCHKTLKAKLWFWEGSVHGYGPFTFQCAVCNRIIHEEKTPTPN